MLTDLPSPADAILPSGYDRRASLADFRREVDEALPELDARVDVAAAIALAQVAADQGEDVPEPLAVLALTLPREVRLTLRRIAERVLVPSSASVDALRSGAVLHVGAVRG